MLAQPLNRCPVGQRHICTLEPRRVDVARKGLRVDIERQRQSEDEAERPEAARRQRRYPTGQQRSQHHRRYEMRPGRSQRSRGRERQQDHGSVIDDPVRHRRPAATERSGPADARRRVAQDLECDSIDEVSIIHIRVSNHTTDVLRGRVDDFVPPSGWCDLVDPEKVEPPLERGALGGTDGFLPADMDNGVRVTNEEPCSRDDHHSAEHARGADDGAGST